MYMTHPQYFSFREKRCILKHILCYLKAGPRILEGTGNEQVAQDASRNPLLEVIWIWKQITPATTYCILQRRFRSMLSLRMEASRMMATPGVCTAQEGALNPQTVCLTLLTATLSGLYGTRHHLCSDPIVSQHVCFSHSSVEKPSLSHPNRSIGFQRRSRSVAPSGSLTATDL